MKRPGRLVKPELSMFGIPDWFHHHAGKMQVVALVVEEQFLKIEGSAAELIIRYGRPSSFGKTHDWIAEWRVIYSTPDRCETQGRIFIESECLEAAFGLSELSGDYGDWLIERYGADSAEQGCYIRYQECLNIPGPGTGHDYDPNVSIYIDEKMKESVQTLLALIQ